MRGDLTIGVSARDQRHDLKLTGRKKCVSVDCYCLTVESGNLSVAHDTSGQADLAPARWRADRGTALFRNCVKTCSYRYRYTKTQLLKPVLTDLRPGQQAGWYGLVGLQRVEERERLRPVPQHGVARGRDVVSVGDRHRAGLRATQRERRLEQVVQVGALVDGDRTRRRRGERQCGERVQVHARACRLGEQRLEKRPLVLNTLQV